MEITEKRQGAVTVLCPRGPLLSADVPVFAERANGAVARSLGRVVLDASDMAYVDSDGLEAMLDLTDRLAETGGVLKLCGANETVRETLDLTELTPMFECFADVQSAVRSFL